MDQSTFRRPVLPVNRNVSQENSAPDTAGAFFKKQVSTLSSTRLSSIAPKKIKVNHEDSSSLEANPMDKLLSKLSEQKVIINNQHETLKSAEDIAYSRTLDYVATTAKSHPVTPIGDNYNQCSTSTANTQDPMPEDNLGETNNLVLLRAQLEAATSELARRDQELAQSRITKHTLDQAIGNVSETDFNPLISLPLQSERFNGGPSLSNSGLRPSLMRDNSWQAQDDTRSDTSDALSAGGFNRARAIWSNKPAFGSFPPPVLQQPSEVLDNTAWANRPYGQAFIDTPMPSSAPPQITTFRAAQGAHRNGQENEFLMAPPPPGRRGPARFNNRSQPAFPYAGSASSHDGYTLPNHGLIPTNNGSGPSGGFPYPPAGFGSPVGGNMFSSLPQPIGTALSPHAPEFTSATATEGQTYLPTTEPLNYRRLLDRNVSCDWNYIVDKIVCNNDQQASIFLQQKLKIGTTQQKYDIVEAIVAQAYPLMINRFGNFLIQRCFEHGTPQQVIHIAEGIRGNTLNLSMDAFGCHVVQKAFDSVPEDYKAIMVKELLLRIPETVIHRYACHVWQKLFELRWTATPPQIMQYVNEALRGMWHEVALGETGSLVVQNIFENCLEEDKRPCIEEVLGSIDIVAHGQFGNWCIQHICEHGAPADRGRAIDHVIRYASEYSMDQFASKVVEKCLKIGGVEFLGRYLERVCEGRHDRPRIPLIDIASDQYGNYLIQYILTHSNPQHREIVAQHIRKHMVSLRGSKFGSRVGMLCTNPAIQTRPGHSLGPPLGTQPPRMGPQGAPRYAPFH